MKTPCTQTESSGYLRTIRLTPVSALGAGMKTIAIGVRHPLD